MRRASAVLLALALVALAWPTRAEATIFRGRPVARPYRPVYSTQHMPGWDWWRTYPYSPYNYGRNPYNPIILPYPYFVPQPYPVYVPNYTTAGTGLPVPAVPPVPPVPPVPTLSRLGTTRAR